MTPPSNVTVLGAGAWGTALAAMLAGRGISTILCARRDSHLVAVRAARENATYLPGVSLPANLALSTDWSQAVSAADVVIVAIPSAYARAALNPIAQMIPADAIVVSATKGIEQTTLKTMTQVFAEVLTGKRRLAVLSGPGFATEVARGRPAALVAASQLQEAAHIVQNLLAGQTLRVYSSSDVVGVELCGAAKNVIAIASGISDGLNLGSSARAAVITRGLAEIMRLVAAAGGRRETAAGLAGMGDLVLTCTGELSRNHAAGIAFSRGELSASKEAPEGHSVAEGIGNARSVKALADGLKVEMPIVTAVYRGLYEGQAPNAIVGELLHRGLKAEF